MTLISPWAVRAPAGLFCTRRRGCTVAFNHVSVWSLCLLYTTRRYLLLLGQLSPFGELFVLIGIFIVLVARAFKFYKVRKRTPLLHIAV